MTAWSQCCLPNISLEWRIGIASVVAGGCAAVLLYGWFKQPKNLPPGPIGVPLIGALLSLSEDFNKDFSRFSEKYKSDVVSFCSGTSLIVVLNSERVVRDAFAREEFSGRPTSLSALFGISDLLFTASYSETWRKNKKFMMQSLRAFGFGTPKSEEKITNQLKNLEEVIDAGDNKAWSKEELDQCLNKVTANIILDIVFGNPYSFDDPELREWIEAAGLFQEFLVADCGLVGVLDTVLPHWLTKLVFCRSIRRATKITKTLFDLAARRLPEHQAMANSSTEPLDFLDALLLELKKQPEITEELIINTLNFIIPDSIYAVAGQIMWCLAYLVTYPSNQRRMVDEIKSVCGNRPPTLQDKTKLPFCECVILESMRLSSIFSMAAPHVTTADTTLDGYNIPSGTTVFANIYTVQRNPKEFSLPEEFSPDRFLEESGSITRSTSVIPFSTGTRMCLGESLVKCELFLAVTRLVFQYHISSLNSEPISLLAKGIFRSVPDSNIVFTKRM